jgi:hypothetical protein
LAFIQISKEFNPIVMSGRFIFLNKILPECDLAIRTNGHINRISPIVVLWFAGGDVLAAASMA